MIMSCDGLERRLARWMPYFSAWTAFTPEIPKLYWDVKSQEQRYFAICKDLHKIICYLDCLSDHVNIDHKEIEELRKLLDDFIDHGFKDTFAALIIQWLDEHQKEVWEHLGKMVFFGLTMDGYFTAYVPNSWSDIVFDTGAIYGTYEYGRLILCYNVDGSADVTTTPTDTGSLTNMLNDLRDLEKRVAKNEITLYTALEKQEQ